MKIRFTSIFVLNLHVHFFWNASLHIFACEIVTRIVSKMASQLTCVYRCCVGVIFWGTLISDHFGNHTRTYQTPIPPSKLKWLWPRATLYKTLSHFEIINPGWEIMSIRLKKHGGKWFWFFRKTFLLCFTGVLLWILLCYSSIDLTLTFTVAISNWHSLFRMTRKDPDWVIEMHL